MNNRAVTLMPAPECKEFLFAVIDEAPNGTQLTVLSALAQADVDPWEETMRLSAMPKVTAERALVSIFDRIPERKWSRSEEATMAARLVKLLPPRSNSTESATISRPNVQRSLIWLVWVSLAIAASILSVPRHPPAPVDSGISEPSGATAPSKNSSADGALKSAGDGGHSANRR